MLHLSLRDRPQIFYVSETIWNDSNCFELFLKLYISRKQKTISSKNEWKTISRNNFNKQFFKKRIKNDLTCKLFLRNDLCWFQIFSWSYQKRKKQFVRNNICKQSLIDSANFAFTWKVLSIFNKLKYWKFQPSTFRAETFARPKNREISRI